MQADRVGKYHVIAKLGEGGMASVFLSCVRSGGGVGFLALPNRLNVAMSRAKRLLVAVGDARTVRQVQPLADFLVLCRERGFHDSM